MLSELLFFTRIFSLILRGNTHISKNFLRILLIGATLGTKIFHEYGPWTVAQWSKVLFSDESKFCISFGNKVPESGGTFMEMLISFSSRTWHLPTLPKIPKAGSVTMVLLCLIGQQTRLT